MKTKILVALILLVTLVIIIMWKRWICTKCGCDTRKYDFDVDPVPTPPGPGCKCTCLVPENNPSICHVEARYWLSGGDGDALAVSDVNSQNLLSLILTFATWDTLGDGSHKFLWVESKSAPSPGHVTAATALPLLGLNMGIDYDWVDGTELATSNLNAYTAICVASTSTGMLTASELTTLHSRSVDILNFTKQGGSLVVFAGLEPNSYTWMPVAVSTSPVLNLSGFTATAIGSNVGLSPPTMEYPHSLIFDSYPTNILIPAETNDANPTSLISKSTRTFNPCLDKKTEIPDTSSLCAH
jgi:hypothetical protein